MTIPIEARPPRWFPFGRDVQWTWEGAAGDDIDVWSIRGQGMAYVAPTARLGVVLAGERADAYNAAVDALCPPEAHRAGPGGPPARFGWAVAVLDVADAVASLQAALS